MVTLSTIYQGSTRDLPGIPPSQFPLLPKFNHHLFPAIHKNGSRWFYQNHFCVGTVLAVIDLSKAFATNYLWYLQAMVEDGRINLRGWGRDWTVLYFPYLCFFSIYLYSIYLYIFIKNFKIFSLKPCFQCKYFFERFKLLNKGQRHFEILYMRHRLCEYFS